MKLKFLSTFIICSTLSITSISQVYYSEDFESVTAPALPTGITSVDSDGDGYEWGTMDASQQAPWTNNGTIAFSESYSNSAGALNPDNLLIVGPIDLSSASAAANLFLTWDAGATEATSTGWHEENYSVYVETSTTPGTALYSETLSAGQTLFNRSVDVLNFAGNSSVYLIFRHHNCTDEWRLGIDNISVKTIQPDNATLTQLSTPSFAVSGNIDITGEIKNNGANNITSLDVTWTDGSGLNVDNLTGLNIAPGGTYSFTHGTPLSVTGGNNYTVTVEVILSNDGDLSDNSLTSSISGLTFSPNKINVGEEKTGEWCGWCPRGAVAMAEMANSNPNDFIGIAVHNGDGMTVSAYDANIGNYISGGYPGGGVDRVLNGDPSDFLLMHNQRKSAIVPGEVYASGTYDANTITVNISAKFAATFSGDYRLAAVLIGDSILGSGQANYYSGGSAGTLIMPNSGSMPGLNFSTSGQTVSPFYHDHVAIALGNNDINGTSGSLPSSINANDSLTYSYSFNRVASWNMGKVHVVGMLINGVTGEILNAGKGNLTSTSVGINNLDFQEVNLNVYPNPINEKAIISFNCVKQGRVSVDIINSIGQTLISNDLGLISGEQQILIDPSNMPSGIYFVKVTIDNKNYSKRINVVK